MKQKKVDVQMGTLCSKNSPVLQFEGIYHFTAGQRKKEI
jgi:hypothetical protein